MPDLCTAACAELGGTWGAVFGIAGLVFAWWQRRQRERLRVEKDAVIRELSMRPPPMPLVIKPLPPLHSAATKDPDDTDEDGSARGS